MDEEESDLAARSGTDIDPPEVVEGEPADEVPGAKIIRIRAGFSGPLPPPELLAEYDAVLPGGADRIVSMAENQSAHRLRMESRGQAFGFLIALVAILGGIGLILDGKSAAGLVPLIGALGGLAGIFVYGEFRARQARRLDADQDASPATLPNE